MARHVRDLAAELRAPLGVVLEGGYQPDVLAESVQATLSALADGSPATSAAPEALLTSRAAAHVGHFWEL